MTDSYLALKNGGWNNRRLLKGDEEGANNDAAVEYKKNRGVAVYRFPVSEFGTYKVDVSIAALEKDIEGAILFSGRRNMIAMGINIPKGETYHKTFYQAVFPYIPALQSQRCNDKYIFVSVAGISDDEHSHKVDVSIVREDVPVIWVAGDSTLTDQNAGIPYYPYGSCGGWAQTIARYFDKAAVCNLAHSGMTSNCFRDDGHYDICREYMKEGDVFIMQFGHNDQKRRNLAAFGGYADNLRRYVSEVRDKGVEPIICSPISRIPLSLSEDEAKELLMPRHYSLLWDYADAACAVAEEMDVTFIDLHEKTFDKWVELGDKTKDFFMPGDITHTNEYGAVLIGDFFMSLLSGKNIESNFWPDSDTKILPKEAPCPSIFDIEPPYVDIKGIPEEGALKKPFRYALLDPCVMYLHPYDEMPRGQLLMVMFNAFRMAGVRPYKKKFADIKVDEWISGYVQALIDNDMIDGDEFRPDDPVTYEELSRFLILKLQKSQDEKTKELLKTIDSQALYRYTQIAAKLGLINNNESPDKVINRAEVYITLAKFMDYVGSGMEALPEDAEVHPVH